MPLLHSTHLCGDLGDASSALQSIFSVSCTYPAQIAFRAEMNFWSVFKMRVAWISRAIKTTEYLLRIVLEVYI